jgi:hypothetical protein
MNPDERLVAAVRLNLSDAARIGRMLKTREERIAFWFGLPLEDAETLASCCGRDTRFGKLACQTPSASSAAGEFLRRRVPTGNAPCASPIFGRRGRPTNAKRSRRRCPKDAGGPGGSLSRTAQGICRRGDIRGALRKGKSRLDAKEKALKFPANARNRRGEAPGRA